MTCHPGAFISNAHNISSIFASKHHIWHFHGSTHHPLKFLKLFLNISGIFMITCEILFLWLSLAELYIIHVCIFFFQSIFFFFQFIFLVSMFYFLCTACSSLFSVTIFVNNVILLLFPFLLFFGNCNILTLPPVCCTSYRLFIDHILSQWGAYASFRLYSRYGKPFI